MLYVVFMSGQDPEGKPADNEQNPDFIPEYEHTDRDTGEVFSAPFPVVVFGIRNEFFGVGKVTGSINSNPVIEAQDRDDGRTYRVMGYESWWSCPVPEEVVDKIASGELAIESVAAYRQVCDDRIATRELGDQSFLGDSGIDPDSL